MKKNIITLILLGMTFTAQATGTKLLNGMDSKKLYSAMNVVVIDADDISEKHFQSDDFSISCFKSVVDKSASCQVPNENKYFSGLTAKKLYKALKIPKVDHDDIISKSFIGDGFEMSCEYGVVDKVYNCASTVAVSH